MSVPTALPEAPGAALDGAHALDGEVVAELLQVDPSIGLGRAEAASRLERFGPNELPSVPPRPRWLRFLDQFRDGIVGILAVAAVVAGVIGDIKDTIIIGVVLVLNATLGYLQEQRAEQGLAALNAMVAQTARVRRDGAVLEIATSDVVGGDVLLLEAGERVSADGRVLVAHRVEVDESPLTGESEPVAKGVGVVPADAALADRTGSMFRSTAVTRGRAELVVTAVGAATELGRVAAMLEGHEPDRTPLQHQLDKLGKRLALVAFMAVGVYAALSLARGRPVGDTAIEAVALAVAAIPEGLPAVVTVALALATSQMARHGAIVRRLASVETLGATSVICSDKTGTLTLNQMTARAMVHPDGRRFSVTGEGYGSDGELVEEPSGSDWRVPGSLPDGGRLLRGLALCTDAHVTGGALVGDPTEGALVVLAQKAGLDVERMRRRHPRIGEVPFDPAAKLMVTVHELPDDGADDTGPARRTAVVKGAPDVLLARCELDAEAREVVVGHVRVLAEQGLRVLAVAEKALPDAVDVTDADRVLEAVQGAELLGLVGLLDPPRPEAAAAIAACRRAGVRFVMITGDHPDTAGAIALAVGIEGDTLTGAQLDALDDEQLRERVDHVGVVARVSPEHKVRMVAALRARGQIVAMTGDGVNDAPALRAADIGVAMGVTGTAVAKDASDLVLTDDHVGTIVEAVARGRALYRNIVTFVRFQLSTNIAALVTIMAAEVARLPVPFTAAQLLWVNLVMDGPPALALAADPPTGGELDDPPRKAGEAILSLRRLVPLVAVALVMAGGTLVVLDQAHGAGGANADVRAATLAFTTFVLYQVVNALVVRAGGRSLVSRATLRNPRLAAALGAVVTLQVLAVQTPVGHGLFDTVSLRPGDWGVAAATALGLAVVNELVVSARQLLRLGGWVVGVVRAVPIGAAARKLRVAIVGLVGAALLLAGVVMLVLPGPGLVVIVAGLAVLATEFAWAERWLRSARDRAAKAKETAAGKLGRKSPRR